MLAATVKRCKKETVNAFEATGSATTDAVTVAAIRDAVSAFNGTF